MDRFELKSNELIFEQQRAMNRIINTAKKTSSSLAQERLFLMLQCVTSTAPPGHTA